MSIVLSKLQLHYAQFPKALNPADGKTWIFDKQLAKQRHDFFLPLLHKQPSLRLEYEVLQTQLSGFIQSEADLACYQDSLIIALILAETLQYQYKHYLIDEHETAYFQRQADSLKKLLGHFGYVFPKEHSEKASLIPKRGISQVILDQTNYYTIFRQIIFRSRKLIIEIDHFLNNTATKSRVASIDHVVSPILNYLALLFFLPRTTHNLWVLGKHTLPGFWMEGKEKNLPWLDRLSIQLKQRGFELGDDLVWCAVNISICFVLTGPLSPWVFPILMSQQIYEVFSRISKLVVQIKPLIELHNHYLNLLEGNELTTYDKQKIQDYLAHLDKRIEYEIKQRALKALNSSTILILGLLTLSLFSASPVITTVGAGLIVSATILFYMLHQSLNKNSPNKPHAFADKAREIGLFSKKNVTAPSVAKHGRSPRFLHGSEPLGNSQ